jgi:hypothetical protein
VGHRGKASGKSVSARCWAAPSAAGGGDGEPRQVRRRRAHATAVEEALASGVAAVKVHEHARGGRGIARVIPAAMPYVADCNNAHTLADIRATRSAGRR